MRNIYFVIILLLLTVESNAQSTNDVGKIALSVVMPDNFQGLDAMQLSKLESKISQIVTASGVSASGYNNNFVIYPKFAIYESNIVEGGMQNITVVTAELSLFIEQVDNNILFTTTSKQLKGSGSNKEQAITNAISKIPTNDSDFKNFIETGKNKIVSYYESKCDDILSKSENLTKMQDFEQALGLLMTVPDEVNCYNKVREKSIEVFKAYQNHKCSVLLQNAKSKIAANEYKTALAILEQIDPAATCYKEVLTLMEKIETKIDVEDKKQWDLKMKMYNDGVALEKERIHAIKEVAVAYYKSKPSSVNYNYIIK